VSPALVRVYLEVVPKRAFAVAIEWPGWSRSGRTLEVALETLVAYAPRYAPVAREAGLPFVTGALVAEIVEQLPGDASTEFGVPARIAAADQEPLSEPGSARQAALVRASWTVFDRTVDAAPGELRKGPRGGGRDTARIVEHVIGADHAYARELGLRLPAPDATDRTAVWAFREAMLEVLARPSDGAPLAKRWTSGYAARRIAWHALDHAWEVEDRSEP
jgi:hypothetical protein